MATLQALHCERLARERRHEDAESEVRAWMHERRIACHEEESIRDMLDRCELLCMQRGATAVGYRLREFTRNDE